MTSKLVSRGCGVLYVATVLAYVASNLFLNERLVDPENVLGTLGLIADNALHYRPAVSVDFLAMVGVMALALTLYTLLKPFNPYFALLALGWRIAEVVLQAGAKLPNYLLLTLSRAAASSPGSATSDVVHLGRILIAGSTQAMWLSLVFFSIGSLFNNWLFHKSRVIPAGLAVFGLVSAVLFTTGSLLALVLDLSEGANMVMMLPLVLFELALGFYLAIHGAKEGVS